MYGQIIATMGYVGIVVEMLVPRRVKQQAMNHVASTKDKVDRRRQRETDRPDFMSHMLRHTEKENGLSFAELYADAQILVIAGSETSATLLAAAMFYLLKHPGTFQKLKDEIRLAFAADDDIKFATVSKLQYLQAVISESLRMHPPLPAGIHRLVPEGGAMIDGKFVTAGTDVHVPHWVAYRSAVNFRDPDNFAPERWMGDERYAADNRDAFPSRSASGHATAWVVVWRIWKPD